MWECGLKLVKTHNVGRYEVTPYVGVWIETSTQSVKSLRVQSLLMWECGLKPV